MQTKWLGTLLGAALALGPSWASARDDDDEKQLQPAPLAPSPAIRAPRLRMGATPGGAQDIDFARQEIQRGDVPHAHTFTAEGLLSQHDLPLDTGRPCRQILCLTAAATTVELLAQPRVRWLAQLAFASNLDPRAWKRRPLNLVAVVDKSGSMSGAPLDTVKASLHEIALQLTPNDQLAIVLYGDRSHIHLPPTRLTERPRVLSSIAAIESAGSTALEAGLRLGYEVAQKSRAGFAGTTRVMLFTDERPNVGATEATSFMGMARDASRQGVGLTTIGVGTHFGAELATAIGSVRGGNLLFFPNVVEMRDRLRRDFDTLVTELAYDLKLVVEPLPGYEVAGLYGLPGDLVTRTPTGGLELTVETIFLSRERGGVFFAFQPASGGAPRDGGGPLATARVSYLDTASRTQRDTVTFELWKQPTLPLGLARGRLLVDEITVLKRASELHRQENQTEAAYRLVHALRSRFQQARVSGLERELTLVTQLDTTLTRLSGHGAEPSPRSRRESISGLP